ncbi:hypothetical protein EVAR_89747_1 [Eumeta japonica]|uniref:Uncharacterized protein n=1 Tax=Eumeta variegata TaxID=151549 RepID=A0A4C1Y6H2_EUMVA|nr:hypothetical protein EVAR_89747_1 [Eumeta japonica]
MAGSAPGAGTKEPRPGTAQPSTALAVTILLCVYHRTVLWSTRSHHQNGLVQHHTLTEYGHEERASRFPTIRPLPFHQLNFLSIRRHLLSGASLTFAESTLTTSFYFDDVKLKRADEFLQPE